MNYPPASDNDCTVHELLATHCCSQRPIRLYAFGHRTSGGLYEVPVCGVVDVPGASRRFGEPKQDLFPALAAGCPRMVVIEPF